MRKLRVPSAHFGYSSIEVMVDDSDALNKKNFIFGFVKYR